MQRSGGKVMINWLAYTKIPPGAPPLEAWDTVADKQACVDQYRGWTYPWLDVHGLFAATPDADVLQLPNVDRDPIPRWSFGRVTLIGDAAHPMQPVGAQAGSQAVVDGRVLAAALMASRDPAKALTRYQNERIAAMNDMIIRNRNLGLESILQTAEERAEEGAEWAVELVVEEIRMAAEGGVVELFPGELEAALRAARFDAAAEVVGAEGAEVGSEFNRRRFEHTRT